MKVDCDVEWGNNFVASTLLVRRPHD